MKHLSNEALIRRLEVDLANKRVKQMESDLIECLTYLEKHYDVVDGGDGEQAPNEAMRLGTMIQTTLYGLGNF